MAEGAMSGARDEFPVGLEVGDFIQLTSNFADVYFEVTKVMTPVEGSSYWCIHYLSYDKYASRPREQWTGLGGAGVRSVIKAAMAVPVMKWKRLRFHAGIGHFDPFYGFAEVGTPLRRRASAEC